MVYTTIADPMTGRASESMIRRDHDGAFIPADPANADWQAYQVWLKAGNAPAEPSGQSPPKQTSTQTPS